MEVLIIGNLDIDFNYKASYYDKFLPQALDLLESFPTSII